MCGDLLTYKSQHLWVRLTQTVYRPVTRMGMEFAKGAQSSPEHPTKQQAQLVRGGSPH